MVACFTFVIRWMCVQVCMCKDRAGDKEANGNGSKEREREKQLLERDDI